ncbi:MAG: peptidylprolyl isomerase [Pseudolabrys sp.]
MPNKTLLAPSHEVGYGCVMKRIAVVTCLILLGLSLAGCTKCGWLWNEGARGCHSDAPRT